MNRVFISFVLFAAGVALAHNVADSHSFLLRAATRNPVTIAVTTYLYDHTPEAIYKFEQDLLHYFAVAPYFGVYGLVAGALLTYRSARLGVLVPMGFAVWFSIQLIQMTLTSRELDWTAFFPEIVSSFTLVPIYLIGTAAGSIISHRRLPTWTLSDCFVATTVACVLCYAIMRRPFLLIPGTLFIACSLIAWRSLRTDTPGVETEAAAERRNF